MSQFRTDTSKEFVGRRALITGGSRGIGAAIAQRLIEGGATVVVTARSRHEQTPEKATFISGDLGSNDDVKKIASEALKTLGGLDILVNNAGAAEPYLHGSSSIPDEVWQDSLNINFLAAVRMTNAVLPALKESKAGAIVSISAGGATAQPGPLLHYGAAKAALNTFNRGLAGELAPSKIRVNIVTPGPVITPGADEVRQSIANAMGIPVEGLLGQVPLGSFGEAHEVAEVVALLVSDRGRWLTGHNYFVDGGFFVNGGMGGE